MAKKFKRCDFFTIDAFHAHGMRMKFPDACPTPGADGMVKIVKLNSKP